MCLMIIKARRGCYRWLSATMWVLEIKPGSLGNVVLPTQPSLQAPYFFLFAVFFVCLFWWYLFWPEERWNLKAFLIYISLMAKDIGHLKKYFSLLTYVLIEWFGSLVFSIYPVYEPPCLICNWKTFFSFCRLSLICWWVPLLCRSIWLSSNPFCKSEYYSRCYWNPCLKTFLCLSLCLHLCLHIEFYCPTFVPGRFKVSGFIPFWFFSHIGISSTICWRDFYFPSCTFLAALPETCCL